MIRGRISAELIVVRVFLATLPIVSCTSTDVRLGDRYFESGRYVEAAAAYEEYLKQGIDNRDSEALMSYRLGLIYARGGSSLYDPLRSVEMLSQSLELQRNSPYSLEAGLLLGFQQESLDLRREVSDRKARIEALFSELSALQEQVEKAEGQAGVREKKVELLSGQIGNLRQQIEALLSEVESKEEELERLKAIDFDIPP